MKLKKKVRIILLVLVMLGIVPLYIIVLLSTPYERKVKEITEETYEELQETDEMYENLPYDAQVTDVYVKQGLGDAYIYVYVTVPEENENEFAKWLDESGRNISKEQDVFYFTYFVSDSHAQFREYEEPNFILFSKIYWTIGICLIIFLIIPFERILKDKDQ